MEFEMNNAKWKIIEETQRNIKNMINKRNATNTENIESKEEMYYGITYNDIQIIYIDKDLTHEMKKKTLLHELTHCYITSYITHLDLKYSEEEVADIVSNSHIIISEIYNKYFEGKK